MGQCDFIALAADMSKDVSLILSFHAVIDAEVNADTARPSRFSTKTTPLTSTA